MIVSHLHSIDNNDKSHSNTPIMGDSMVNKLEKMSNRISKRKKKSKDRVKKNKPIVVDDVSDVPELENPTIEDLYDILKKNRELISKLKNDVKEIKEEIGEFVTLSHLGHVSSNVSDITNRVSDIESTLDGMQ